MNSEAEHPQAAVASATSNGAAVTMTNASSSARGRRPVKFTPQAIEKIKELVAEGISRDEIATRLGVTVGSLQVTCSRLGVSLRHVAEPAARAAPVAQFAITMRHQGKEQTTDVPLPSPAIGVLALEAMSRDSDLAGLVGQVLVAAINKDMIHKILR
jgi:DNA-binding CsgD family transcriptional regulator